MARVFVADPDEVLEAIKEVEYILHPTSADPVQVKTNPKDRFALETAGLGTFDIAIPVKFKDGAVVDESYRLDAGDSPRVAVS